MWHYRSTCRREKQSGKTGRENGGRKVSVKGHRNPFCSSSSLSPPLPPRWQWARGWEWTAACGKGIICTFPMNEEDRQITQWIRTACGSLCQRHGNNYRPPKSIHTEGQWRNGCVGPVCVSARSFRVALTTRQMDPANNPGKISEFRHIIAAGQY